jgi:hypothetical protein
MKANHDKMKVMVKNEKISDWKKKWYQHPSQLAMTYKPIGSRDGGCSRTWKNDLRTFLCHHKRVSGPTLALIMMIKYIKNMLNLPTLA